MEARIWVLGTMGPLDSLSFIRGNFWALLCVGSKTNKLWQNLESWDNIMSYPANFLFIKGSACPYLTGRFLELENNLFHIKYKKVWNTLSELFFWDKARTFLLLGEKWELREKQEVACCENDWKIRVIYSTSCLKSK